MSMENQPPMGRNDGRFRNQVREVSTQVASSTVAERLPAMCGRATLATLVSSTSMNVASIPVMAMIHGLMARGLMAGRVRMTVLLGVERLHLSDAARQIRARLIVAVQSADLIVAGTRQLILRLRSLRHCWRQPTLEAVESLIHFLAGEVEPELGDVHFATRAGKLRDRVLHFQDDAVAYVLLLLFELTNRDIGLGALGLNPAPREDGNFARFA